MPGEIETESFRLVLPPGDWADRSDAESFDYVRGDQEQVLAVLYGAKEPWDSQQLLSTVIQLFKHRLNALQENSGNACQFESPEFAKTDFGCVARVIGFDQRNLVRLQLGLFGTPEKIVAVSHYDYTGTTSAEDFKQCSDELFDGVEVR